MKKLLAGVICLFFLTAATDEDVSTDLTYRELDLLAKVLELVKDTYVEEVNEQELLEAAIRGMLNDLDPHSGYMDANMFKQTQIQTRGEYGGVGIEVVPENNVLKIIAPMDDTPASRAGLISGDYITHIDGQALVEIPYDEAIDSLRGEPGEPALVTIFRPGTNAPFDVTLVREVIQISAVRHRVERDSIGYIRLTTFNNEKLTRDLIRSINELEEELGPDLKGFVLDLRNNPGGLLDQAIEVTDVFLDRGEIVSMKGRQRSENARWNATRGDETDGLPIIILINAGTASASEIVAGALQDHKRATVIGVESFGKGVVQTVYPLAEDRAVRITTARYYTPSGNSIQAVGIDPDIVIEQPIFDNQGNRISFRRERDLSGHIPNENGGDGDEEAALGEETLRPEPELDEEGQVKDYQLQYALDLLTGVIEVEQRQALMEEAE